MHNSKNSKTRFALAVAAAALAAAAFSPAALADSASKDGNGNVYFKTSTLEIGLNPGAVFGARNGLPGDFHPRWPSAWANNFGTDTVGLVAVADPASPDWANIRGDFATDWDGLELMANGDYWHNNTWVSCENCGGIPGAWDSPDPTTGQLDWHMAGDRNGVHMDITVKPVPDTTTVVSTYKLTNVTESDIPNVGIDIGDNSFVCPDTTNGNLTINGQVSTGADTSSITKTYTCNDETVGSITWASPDAGAAASFFSCNISYYDEWGNGPNPLLTSTNGCFHRSGAQANTGNGMNIAIGVDPANSNTLKAGQSVELHIARCMNESEAATCGQGILPPLLEQKTPLTGGTAGGVGTVTAVVNGSDGINYEVSDDRYFRHGWKKAVKGDTIVWKVASSQIRKGKIGTTKLWIRNAKNRFATTKGYAMPWDFSPPIIVGGSTHALYVKAKPVAGQWIVNVKASDKSNPGNRGLRLQLATGAAAPSDSDAFPEANSSFTKDWAAGNIQIGSSVPLRWARLQDNFGNVSKWTKLASLPLK